jgi:hypothetical protein
MSPVMTSSEGHSGESRGTVSKYRHQNMVRKHKTAAATTSTIVTFHKEIRSKQHRERLLPVRAEALVFLFAI